MVGSTSDKGLFHNSKWLEIAKLDTYDLSDRRFTTKLFCTFKLDYYEAPAVGYMAKNAFFLVSWMLSEEKYL